MGDTDRHRLQRQAAEEIGARFTALGYTVKVRGHKAVMVYNGTGNDAEYVAAFYWVNKRGWRLDLSQPILYTNFDLETAVEELQATQEAVKAVDVAWDEYNGKRNDENWKKYQGAMAAHQTRGFGRTWIKGTGS